MAVRKKRRNSHLEIDVRAEKAANAATEAAGLFANSPERDSLWDRTFDATKKSLTTRRMKALQKLRKLKSGGRARRPIPITRRSQLLGYD